MASTQFMPYFDLYVRERLTILSRIIWFYDGLIYEPILHCVKDADSYCFNTDDILVEAKTGAKRKLIDYRRKIPKQYNTKKVPSKVWEFPRVRYRMNEYENHPSQKPESLLNRIIRASSCKGDTVLDPFAGTFTAAAVAKSLDRKSISIETQEEYLKIGLRHVLEMKQYLGEKLTTVQKNMTVLVKEPV
jgi:adenine-specific DNA-methyltransferase